MNIIIFGANGRTGRELISQALKQGHSITAFVREPAKLDIVHENLRIVQGQVIDYADIDKVAKSEHYDAAFSALGAKSMFKREPLLIEAMKNIIKAMEENGISQLIHISFTGVRKDSEHLGMLYKHMIPLFMKNLLRDHREKDALLKNSRLNWTLVQPPILTSGPFTGNYIHEAEIAKGKSYTLKLSRANLADFMLKQLQDPTYHHQEVFVTE
ncbi:NAD(P)H-binding protein [Paenibacillus sp. HJL G12]|uniref:NAD(P)H-binding protein n=1 Tax=Paenibacillus dendrobii TaxID=2691084 RepID=A0A7X3LGS4_9BACL|nr:SDR family oxidoreductase [Paenibacillus dendrobii]MWV42803.1 NAD(P)H-binding protein [Paenibacillus dendrobii]